MDPIQQIDVQGVTRSFGHTLALRGIDASFTAGQIATIEGHNGSGKSTLLGIIGTILRPSHGRVRYGGYADETSAEVRRQIGWVSHETHCYPDLTPAQNLRLAASLYSASAGAWQKAADRFAVGPFADFPLRQLSRGQRQRVALARAIVHAPNILLLDEPTTGLDSDGTARLLATIGEEAARGCIVIFVTHDSALAEKIAHKRLVLERGRLKA